MMIQFCLPRDCYDSNSCCFHYFVEALVHPLERCLLMIVNPNVGDNFVSQCDWIWFLFYYLRGSFVLLRQHHHHRRRRHHHPHLDGSRFFLWNCLTYLRCILFDYIYCILYMKKGSFMLLQKKGFQKRKTIVQQLNSMKITLMSMVNLGPIYIVLAMLTLTMLSIDHHHRHALFPCLDCLHYCFHLIPFCVRGCVSVCVFGNRSSLNMFWFITISALFRIKSKLRRKPKSSKWINFTIQF